MFESFLMSTFEGYPDRSVFTSQPTGCFAPFLLLHFYSRIAGCILNGVATVL